MKQSQRYLASAFLPILLLPVMLVLVMIAPAAARTTIQLETGDTLSFAEGSVDMRSGSGELRDVALLEGDDLVLRADYIRIDAAGTIGEADWFIRELVAENAEIPEERIFIGRIELRDIAAGMIAEGAPDAAVEQLVTANTLVRFENMGIDAPDAMVSVDLITTLPFAFGLLSSGELVVTSAGFDIQGVTVMAQDDQGQDPFFQALEARGISDLGMDMRVESRAEVGGDDLRVFYGIETGMGELSSLRLGLVLSINQDAYQRLVPLLSDPEENAAALLGLSGAAALDGAELVIEDSGMLDVLFEISAAEGGMSTGEARSMVRMVIAAALQESFPGTAARLLPPIEAMIRSGGRLTLMARPEAPVPLSSAVGFAMFPDMAVDQLGVSITHTP